MGGRPPQAAGDAICVIDVDCEDPPEMIPTFIQHWEAGYDVVYGERDRRAEPFPSHLDAQAVLPREQMIADSDILLDMASSA